MARASFPGLVLVAVLAAALTGTVAAEEHDKPAPAPAATPFPADIGGPFALIDQNGRPVTDADFRGRFMLVYFGYAKCPGVCPIALRHMSDALDLMGAEGERIQPLLITVDPQSDTPEVLAEAIPKIHPRMIGLTGTAEALAAARKAYKVEAAPIDRTSKGIQIFRHGTFIYLMGPDGVLLSVLPPIMGPERMAEILRGYLS